MLTEAWPPILNILARAGALLAQDRFYEWHWVPRPMWWGWGIGMMAMMFVFWLIMIIGFVVGIRWLFGKGKGAPPDSALEILRQRYARGEINQDEFETKKKDLDG